MVPEICIRTYQEVGLLPQQCVYGPLRLFSALRDLSFRRCRLSGARRRQAKSKQEPHSLPLSGPRNCQRSERACIQGGVFRLLALTAVFAERSTAYTFRGRLVRQALHCFQTISQHCFLKAQIRLDDCLTSAQLCPLLLAR